MFHELQCMDLKWMLIMIYIYIYIYRERERERENEGRYFVSSSSKAVSMDFPDSLTIHPYCPSLLEGPLGYIQCPHRANVFASQPTLTCLYVRVHENVAYEFILTSPTVIRMSYSSYLNGL